MCLLKRYYLQQRLSVDVVSFSSDNGLQEVLQIYFKGTMANK